MNIWYFNHYAGGPGLGKHFRAYYLVRAWAKMGHETTVFMARFHHMLDKTKPLSGVVVLDGVRYVPLEGRVYKGNGIGRILNTVDYARAISHLPSRVPADFSKPDAIIASSPHPFSILPAARLAKRYDAQLTFEVRDLWPLSLTEITATHPSIPTCWSLPLPNASPTVDPTLSLRCWAAPRATCVTKDLPPANSSTSQMVFPQAT